MPSDLELFIQERLNQMTDMIEIMSFMQRKMQVTDEKLIRQTSRFEHFDKILRTNEKENN